MPYESRDVVRFESGLIGFYGSKRLGVFFNHTLCVCVAAQVVPNLDGIKGNPHKAIVQAGYAFCPLAGGCLVRVCIGLERLCCEGVAEEAGKAVAQALAGGPGAVTAAGPIGFGSRVWSCRIKGGEGARLARLRRLG